MSLGIFHEVLAHPKILTSCPLENVKVYICPYCIKIELALLIRLFVYLIMAHYNIATRAQAVILKAEGRKYAEIEASTGMSKSAIRYTYKKALDRGWHPTENPQLRDEHVIDGERPGAPKKLTEEKIKEIVDRVIKDRYGREKSADYVSTETGVSRSSVLRALKSQKFRKVKVTKKPGLSEAQREGQAR